MVFDKDKGFLLLKKIDFVSRGAELKLTNEKNAFRRDSEKKACPCQWTFNFEEKEKGYQFLAHILCFFMFLEKGNSRKVLFQGNFVDNLTDKKNS